MNETESPALVKYAGDLFFIILFLVVFFFYKPGENDETGTSENLSDEEKPNPLEEVLKSDANPDAESDENDENDK